MCRDCNEISDYLDKTINCSAYRVKEINKGYQRKTILENYHEVPDEYKAGSSFFTVGHEFGHITTHPGKDSDYWMNGANNFPIEAANRQKWLNVLSDIIVNWSVMTGSNIRERGGIEKNLVLLSKYFINKDYSIEIIFSKRFFEPP